MLLNAFLDGFLCFGLDILRSLRSLVALDPEPWGGVVFFAFAIVTPQRTMTCDFQITDRTFRSDGRLYQEIKMRVAGPESII